MNATQRSNRAGRWLGLCAIALASTSPIAARATAPQQPRLDRHGDPLPPGAIARMGTTRLRQFSWVERVAFSPDGRTLAGAGGHSGIRFWNVETGRLKERVALPAEADRGVGRVTDLVYSPDGRWAAFSRNGISSGDAALQVWDVERLELMTAIEIPPASPTERLGVGVGGLAVTPDGKSLIGACDDGAIRIWDVATGDAVVAREFPDIYDSRRARGYTDLALSPDGRRAAAMIENGRFLVWELGAESASFVVDAHTGLVGPTPMLVFSLDGKRIYSTGATSVRSVNEAGETIRERSTEARVWSAATGERIAEFPFEAESGHVRGLCLLPDGKTLAVSYRERPILLLDAATGEVMERLKDEYGRWSGGDLAVSPNGRLLASAGPRSAVSLWSLETKERLHHDPNAHVDMPRSMAYSPDGSIVATSDMDGVLRLWDPESGALIRSIAALKERGALYSAAFSPDSRLLATAGVDIRGLSSRGIALVFDVSTGAEVARFENSGGAQYRHAAFSPDGRLLAASHSGAMGLPPPPEGGAPPPDENPVLLDLWSLESRELVRQFRASRRFMLDMFFAFAPDGQRMIVREERGEARVWDLGAGVPRLRFDIGLGPLAGQLALTSDGKHLVAAGAPNEPIPIAGTGQIAPAGVTAILFWSLESGEAARRATSPFAAIGGIQLLANGDAAVISGETGDGVVLWDLNEGRLLHRFEGVRGLPRPIALAPDERTVAIGMNDGTIAVYEMPERR